MLTWHNSGNSTWVAKDKDGTHVATAVKTGTYLDNYPWEWYFTDPIVKTFTFKKVVDVCDTLTRCKDEIGYHWSKRVRKQ